MSRFKFKPDKRIDGKGTISNGERASFGAACVDLYGQMQAHPRGDEADGRDLISDICHWYDREGKDAEEEVRMALDRWREER